LTTLDVARSPFDLSVRASLADKFLHIMLYLCILSSFFVFVQPAPYEYLAVVLGFACVLARVTFSRMVLPVLVLLLIHDAGGAIGLWRLAQFGWPRLTGEGPVVLLEDYGYGDSARFLATSFYLGLTGVMFACMFAQDTMRRIATVRSAYVMAGVIASLLGTIGYFDLYFQFIPGLEIFSINDRAVAGFKEPDIFGCYLIPPLTWLIERLIVDKVRPYNLIATIIIFIGLLLAFSRAAWGSFALSTGLLIYLLFVTQNDGRTRRRIIYFVAGGAVVGAVIFMLLMSVPVVSDTFAQRFHVVQYYDVAGDNRSRILLQQQSLREIFTHPFGMAPWGFAHDTNWVSHNVYLSTMLNDGWLGGIAYSTLVVLTLITGFKFLWVRTPWQTFLIATYFPFLGLVLEALIADTDHWRHFYLLLGLIWGLGAATVKFYRRQAWPEEMLAHVRV
jgi:hypothetical protein